MSCDNTTLYVYVSTLSSTITETVPFSTFNGTVSGSVGLETHIVPVTGMTGTGAGSVSQATVSASTPAIDGIITGSLNQVTDYPAVVPIGTLSGTFTVTQEYANLFDFTGIATGSAAEITGDGFDTTIITLTGDTVDGRNYRAGTTVTATITSGTLSTPGITSLTGGIADEYIEGIISTDLFVDQNASGTLSKIALDDTLTVTITSIGDGTELVNNYPYNVHSLESITINGGELTASVSGGSTSQTVTGGTLSSTMLGYVLTGSNLNSHTVEGFLNTSTSSFPITGTISKTGGDFTVTSTSIIGTVDVEVDLYPLSSISVNGSYGVNPGSAFGSVSGKLLTEVISSGVISSANTYAILQTDSVIDHYIEGTVNTYESLYQTPVSGYITTSGSSYTGVLCTIDGILNTSIDVYQLSSIPLTAGTVTGSVSGETKTVTLTSGTVSSALSIPYVLTTDGVTGIPVTGIGNDALTITGTLTSTGDSYNITIDTVDDHTIPITTYVLSSFALSGGSMTSTSYDSNWTEQHSLTVSITGGTLFGSTQSYMLTSESLTSKTLTGTIDTDHGTLSTSVEFSTIGEELSGRIVDVDNILKELTVTPVSGLQEQFVIKTTAISSSGPLTSILTGETITATDGLLTTATTKGYVDIPLSITGTLATGFTSLTSLLSGDNITGNFYTLHGGGMAGGAGTAHSMAIIPITGGTLTGVSDCLSITRALTGGVLSSASLTQYPLTGTLTAHDVAGHGYTDQGETVQIGGYLIKSVSGDDVWSGTLTSTDGFSTLSELAYELRPIATVTGTVTGSLSSESVSADITSGLLSSTTLTHLLTCNWSPSSLSSHYVIGTITTSDGTVEVGGTIDSQSESGTYAGIITAADYPVPVSVYSLSSIPVTGGEFTTASLSSLTGLTGTLSSTTYSYILTSEVVTSHWVEGIVSNSTFGAVPVSGYITTSSDSYSLSITGNPVSSYSLTAEVISSFPRKELNVGRGHTYTFVLTTPWIDIHPFKFSRTQDGLWSIDGAEYTTNVQGEGGDSPGDEVKLTIDHTTPATLYYYDGSHSDAGGTINITAECSIAATHPGDSEKMASLLPSLVDGDTPSITEKQSDAKASDIRFLFNKKQLTDLKLNNDTKYTFFVNNSTNKSFSINTATGKDASLGSPRQVSGNRQQSGTVTFAKQSNQSQITQGNEGESDPGGQRFFSGEIKGGCNLATVKAQIPSETGAVGSENITNPPGAKSPEFFETDVDCDAPELYKNIPVNTVFRMPMYSRTYTTVFQHTQSRVWEFPTWTFSGVLTAVRAGNEVTFTSNVEGRDPYTTTGTGTLFGNAYTYTWEGVASLNSETLTGTGLLYYGINSTGGETGAVNGNWYTNYNDYPSVSGSETWSRTGTISSATALLSTTSVSPSPGEYKSRFDWILHNLFTTETEPTVHAYGESYHHAKIYDIGPYDNDITFFAGSDIWTNGRLHLHVNPSTTVVTRQFVPTSVDTVGDKIERDTILAVLKAGDTAKLAISGTDGENLWAMGVLSYIETVCLNNFGLDAIEVEERTDEGEPTINHDVTLSPNVTNSLTAAIDGDLSLTLVTIPTEIPDVLYQWYKYSSPIQGAVAATLNFTSTSTVDDGEYYCAIQSPYKYKQTQNISIMAVTYTQELAALPAYYSGVTTLGFAAAIGNMWTTPVMNVQVWRCTAVDTNTLSAVQRVVNNDVAVTPYQNSQADVRTQEASANPTPLWGGGDTKELSAASADPLNWHFVHSNTNGQMIPGITLSGEMDDRAIPDIIHNALGNNTPWNHGADAPVIAGNDDVFLLLLSTPLTGAMPTFPLMDGGQAALVPGNDTQYTHFISQTGYLGNGLTATELSSLKFTADALTGAPMGKTYEHVFNYEPWSHHASASSMGLSGSGENPKILGLTGLQDNNSYYSNGSLLSATFKSLSSMSTYTYLSSTSTYAITGDVVYPDTTFHISTQPGLSGIFAIDVSSNSVGETNDVYFNLYELMPFGPAAENQWMVTREVIEVKTKFTTDSNPGGAGNMNFEQHPCIFHPAVQSLTADTTGDVRYLFVAEWDEGDPFDPGGGILINWTDKNYDDSPKLVSRTYSPSGVLNDGGNGDTDTPGWGEYLPYFTTVGPEASGMTIHGLPTLRGLSGFSPTITNVGSTSAIYGLRGNNLSLEGSTATVSGINTVGHIAVNIEYNFA